MDIISFNEASKANERVQRINANPDSNSGIVTVPKKIEAGETVTVPAGRVAVLPNVQVDGEIVVEAGGEIFIPSGATFGDLEKGLLPIGAILNGYTIFDNCIVAFGGEFNRADYPKLWAYLQANTSLVKTETEWQTEVLANDGICGFYSSGNGTTTFRVPNLDKAFLRPDSRAVASYQNDAFQGHHHTFGSLYLGEFTAGTGHYGLRPFDTSDGLVLDSISDGTNGIPRTENETRPKNIAVLPLIVAK